MKLEILGLVDRRHTTSPKLSLDCVAVGEGGFETVEEAWHSVLAPLATLKNTSQTVKQPDGRSVDGESKAVGGH